MSNRKVLDYLLIYFSFIFVNMFPLIEIVRKWYYFYPIYWTMEIIFLIILHWFLKRRSALSIYPHRPVWKNILLLLPLILICASNFLYLAFVPSNITEPLKWYVPILLVNTVFTVLKEETIFRLILIPNLDKIKTRFWRIIASAGIFGISHISNYLATLDPSYFIQIVYTFGFGIILGFIYEYGRSWVTCMVFHFVFNTINGTFYEMLTNNVVNNYLIYILVNVGVSLAAALYLLIIYFTVFRQQRRIADNCALE